MKKHSRARGFSLVEMMIVVVIILVISALALPSMSRAITIIRLRGAASTVAGMIQKTRIEAVRTNRIMVLREKKLNDGRTSTFYVDGALNNATSKQDGQLDNLEPQGVISKEVQLQFSGYPSFNSQQLLAYDNGASPEPFNLAFNQRGLPCTPDSTDTVIGSCILKGLSDTETSSSSYQYFFKLESTFGDQWASVTVTPAGRVRTWVWNGSTWN